MKDISTTLQELLGRQLSAEGFDMELVQIPNKGDRMVRLRTLEEALEDFDRNENQVGYIIQVKPKQRQTMVEPAIEKPKPSLEGIYYADGKLNIPYLTHNAELLFSTGEYVLARNIYKTLLQSGERTGHTLFCIGRCLEAEGKVEEAQTQYEESIAYHPSLETYQRLAGLLINAKKDHQAAEVLERALHLKDNSPATKFEIYKAAGNCWLRAEKYDQADRSYRKALDIDPMADGIQANLGALQLQRGNLVEARRHYQDAIASNPMNDKAHTGLGNCYLQVEEKRQAHDCFAKALDINLQNPNAIYQLVKCAYGIKSYATAARILGEYVQVAPVNANLLYSLAGLQFHLGRIHEARATAHQIIEINPTHNGTLELIKLIDQRT